MSLRTVYFRFRPFYDVRIQKCLRVWIWKLERNKNNKQLNPPHFHQCLMMDTDHHNSRLSSDQYDKSEQYCCPPMSLKLPYFEISGKPFGNKWDALTSFMNHFIHYYVMLRYYVMIFRIWNDSIWCLKERFVQIFSRLNFIQIFHRNKLFRILFWVFPMVSFTGILILMQSEFPISNSFLFIFNMWRTSKLFHHLFPSGVTVSKLSY